MASKTLLKHALAPESLSLFAAAISKSPLIAFLDYDGTCTPIVKNPDDAVLSEGMKGVLSRFCTAVPTSFVSGRARDKVKRFVGVEHALYAGSHGFEIEGDLEGKGIKHDVAKEHREALAAAMAEISKELSDIPGSVVEDNRFSVSVHFRNVVPAQHEAVEAAVDSALHRHPTLVKRPGKCVYELRPAVDWHKGKAVEYILETLGTSTRTVLVMGDDMTDEDMFGSVKKASASGHFSPLIILVADNAVPSGEGDFPPAHPPRDTHADFYVRSPSEVELLLQRFIGLAGAAGTV